MMRTLRLAVALAAALCASHAHGANLNLGTVAKITHDSRLNVTVEVNLRGRSRDEVASNFLADARRAS